LALPHLGDSVTDPIPGHLRIHREPGDDVAAPDPPVSEWIAEICDRFAGATGWPLHFRQEHASGQTTDASWATPIHAADESSYGYLALGRGKPQAADVKGRTHLADVRLLAESLADMLGELLSTRRALVEREAELAAGVPVVARTDEPLHLAQRLEAVLKGGAESVGCHAAGLYLLDAATTELKLRASWGLPAKLLVEPARQLRSAIADLEALTGHAVVLEDDALYDYWRTPVSCGSAVCVPVGGNSTLLGTLWMFCDSARSYSDQQTNLIEIIAGRLAADLEREMLVSESAIVSNLKRQYETAVRFEHGLWPQTVPELEGWDIAGGTWQADGLGGDFHDWFIRNDGTLAICVGDALDQGAAAAMAATAVRAAIRAHAVHEFVPSSTLASVNETLWTGSHGDLFAAVFYGVLDPDTGRLRYASAGRVTAQVLRKDDWEPLVPCELPLGVQADWEEVYQETTLEPGDVLVVFSDGVRDATDVHGRTLGESTLACELLAERKSRAVKLLASARDLLSDYEAQHDDWTLLVVRRAERPA
jgi:serine phosphatase RsbU (regulator of sigma subunit)